MEVKRFDVCLAGLDPTLGAEMKKTRPVVVVSPNELNRQLQTVIVVPLTTGRSLPFRVATRVQGRTGVAAIDQVRTIDKRRLVKRIAKVPPVTARKILNTLLQMFSPK